MFVFLAILLFVWVCCICAFLATIDLSELDAMLIFGVCNFAEVRQPGAPKLSGRSSMDLSMAAGFRPPDNAGNNSFLIISSRGSNRRSPFGPVRISKFHFCLVPKVTPCAPRASVSSSLPTSSLVSSRVPPWLLSCRGLPPGRFSRPPVCFGRCSGTFHWLGRNVQLLQLVPVLVAFV